MNFREYTEKRKENNYLEVGKISVRCCYVCPLACGDFVTELKLELFINLLAAKIM